MTAEQSHKHIYVIEQRFKLRLWFHFEVMMFVE